MERVPVVKLEAPRAGVEFGRMDRFEFRVLNAAQLPGAAKLGYNISIVLPKKRASSCCLHDANEERFVILSGHPRQLASFTVVALNGAGVDHEKGE